VLPNSVVNHNISSWSVVGGAPAKFKKSITIENQKIIFVADKEKEQRCLQPKKL
jgi:serine acetyltransferase